MWVPSWRTACGLAEYTAHIVASLPHVRVTADAPDVRGMKEPAKGTVAPGA
jgi:hypothetical protein